MGAFSLIRVSVPAPGERPKGAGVHFPEEIAVIGIAPSEWAIWSFATVFTYHQQ